MSGWGATPNPPIQPGGSPPASPAVSLRSWDACRQLSQRFSAEVSGRPDDALFELASEFQLTFNSVGA